MDKRLYQSGFIVYLFLIVLSAIFYKERVILFDTSYQLFSIVLRNYFATQDFRFVSIFTQAFPLLAMRAGLSLKAVTFLYSTGFTLFYTGCYVMCGTIFKQYRIALALLMFNILFVAHTFYWIQCEMFQGIALFMVVVACMASKKATQNPLMMAFIFLGMLTVNFSHMLLLFPVTFVFLFFLLRSEKIIKRKMIYSAAIFFFVLMQLKKMVFRAHYDTMAMNNADNIFKRFPHYFNIESNKRFLQECLTRYYWLPLLAIPIVLLYARKKNWKMLALFVCSTVGYLLLVNVSFPTLKTTDFYMESLYTPLSIFVALPLVFDLLPSLATRKVSIPLFALIVVTCCVRIFLMHQHYTERIDWERRFLAKNYGKKIITATAKAPLDTLTMIWGTPYEFWLLSTIEQNKTASMLIYDNPQNLYWLTGNHKEFITTWGSWPYKDLPAKYFHFDDTVSGYSIDQ